MPTPAQFPVSQRKAIRRISILPVKARNQLPKKLYARATLYAHASQLATPSVPFLFPSFIKQVATAEKPI